MKIYYSVLMLSSVLLLSACGGSDSTTDEVNPLGQFSLGVSDAPMAGVSRLGLVMNELVMTDAAGEIHRYSLQHMEFNLLDYQGMNRHLAIDNIDLPVGQYHNVHVTIDQGDGNQGCYVEDGQGRHSLQVENGYLPIEDVEIIANQHRVMTLEINLYQGLLMDQEQYQLRHRAMWSVDNSQMGHLIGEVDPQWIANCETEYSALTPVGGEFYHLAYLYPDSVTSIDQMADMGTTPPAGLTAPLSVSRLLQTTDGDWYFAMGYLPEGNYRVGYSCLGHLDDPILDDISTGPFVMYEDAGSIAIESGPLGGQQTVHECGNGNGGHHEGHGGHGG
ncbi:MAG: hypothetical protein ACJAW2_000878 [Shewanella sp.]|jgi:hypothetical protein